MPIEDPGALVEKFKKSGEFERLRHDLLREFQKDESYATFKGRIEEIVRQHLAKSRMLHYLPTEMVNKELGQEVERFPVVKRAVTDMKMFSDTSFLADIQTSLQKILRTDALLEGSSSEQKKRKREEDTHLVYEDKQADRDSGPRGGSDSAMSVDKSDLPGPSQVETNPTMKPLENQTPNSTVVSPSSISHHEKTGSNQTKSDDAMDVDDD